MLTHTGDGADAGGGGGDPELPRCSGDRSQASGVVRAAGSKDGAVLPAGGAANSRDGRAPSKTPTPAHVPRPSQGAREEHRLDVGGPRRPHGKSPEHHSRDVRDQHARPRAGRSGVRSQDRVVAPSNTVRSQSTSCSSHLSPPPTPAEVLARAQLLLNFPPAVDKLDEWRIDRKSVV